MVLGAIRIHLENHYLYGFPCFNCSSAHFSSKLYIISRRPQQCNAIYL